MCRTCVPCWAARPRSSPDRLAISWTLVRTAPTYSWPSGCCGRARSPPIPARGLRSCGGRLPCGGDGPWLMWPDWPGWKARLAAGEHLHLVPELEQMVADHPLDEQIHAQLIVALYRCGRQADALSAY